MSEISSYVKLSPKETVIDNWEVVNDAGTPTAGEIILSVIAGVILYYAIYYAFTLVYQFRPIEELMSWRYDYSDELDYDRFSDQKVSETPPGNLTSDEEREAWFAE